jgi:uncharacterized protein involved in type VI secretion and phage assembly
VIVGFEGDSPIKPYVIGTVYHGKASNAYSNGGNDVKALQTRSGNKVIMNDAAGSVFVEDKDGNSMMMDGAGNITVTSNNTVTINATNEITFNTKKITMNAENLISMQSKVLDAQLTETATVYGKTEMNVGSHTAVNIDCDNIIDINAQVETDVFGKTKVSIDSPGQVDVNGQATTSIAGGQVKLNC